MERLIILHAENVVYTHILKHIYNLQQQLYIIENSVEINGVREDAKQFLLLHFKPFGKKHLQYALFSQVLIFLWKTFIQYTDKQYNKIALSHRAV